jgi:hypothetical protein
LEHERRADGWVNCRVRAGKQESDPAIREVVFVRGSVATGGICDLLEFVTAWDFAITAEVIDKLPSGNGQQPGLRICGCAILGPRGERVGEGLGKSILRGRKIA